MSRIKQLPIFLALLCTAICATDTNYRLNSKVSPSEYEITITPFFNTGNNLAFTFDGAVRIKVKPLEGAVDQIKMHSEDLDFIADNVTITTVTGSRRIELNSTNPLEFDKTYTFVYINLATPLSEDTEYYIDVVYRGLIRKDLNGFYRSSYLENGQTKWLGATQMQPGHARKAFPCFDEPEYKATFTLIIDRPENYSASLSNTKLRSSEPLLNGFVRETFFPSPIMSTYLVAFLVSEFQNGGYITEPSHEFGVWVRPEATNQSEFAFDFGQRVVAALGNYFEIDYYSVNNNLKLDHVGIPDFRAGAMENWGLVKYREAYLMYVPTESTPYYKYRVAQIVAHETTHMWFGDLVTCHWWSDPWLNEGFANYFQDYITAQVQPDLGSADILVTGSMYAAYGADATANSVPISNTDVNSPDEVSGHFGTISYQKAGSVIRMIHNLIGDEAFKRGLNRHLDAARFGIVYPTDLYDGLQKGVDYMDSLAAYPGCTVENVMGPWIAQAGHPVIQVDYNKESKKVTLTQRRFYTNDSVTSHELYPIPVTYTTALSLNFNNTKPSFVLTNKTTTLDDNFSDETWIILNIQETGFYRVNYDEHLWMLIGEALRGVNRTNIHYLNRAKIVNDLFAFTTAGLVSFDKTFDILEFLSAETDYSVWYAALSGFNSLRNRLISSSEVKQFETFALRLLEKFIEDLGFYERDEDSYVTLRNRMQVLEFACKLGHKGCIENILEMFKDFKESGTPVPPSLRPVTYCYGLKYGDAEDYDVLYNRLEMTNVANEALVIQEALACTPLEDKLKSYLSQMITTDSPLRFQDITMPLVNVLAIPGNVQLGLNFVKENYGALRESYPKMSTLLSYLPSAMTNDEELTDFEEWLDNCSMCQDDEVNPVKESIQSAKNSLSWTTSHVDDIMSALKGRNSAWTLVPSIFSLVMTIALMMCVS